MGRRLQHAAVICRVFIHVVSVDVEGLKNHRPRTEVPAIFGEVLDLRRPLQPGTAALTKDALEIIRMEGTHPDFVPAHSRSLTEEFSSDNSKTAFNFLSRSSAPS